MAEIGLDDEPISPVRRDDKSRHKQRANTARTSHEIPNAKLPLETASLRPARASQPHTLHRQCVTITTENRITRNFRSFVEGQWQ